MLSNGSVSYFSNCIYFMDLVAVISLAGESLNKNIRKKVSGIEALLMASEKFLFHI